MSSNGRRGRLVDLNVSSQAQSPPGSFGIRTQNRDFSTESLDEEESSIFEEQFNKLINDFDSRLIAELFKSREEQIANVATLAKNQFDEKLFGGINAADNEIGFDILRPGHIRADPATGNIVNNWLFTHPSDGWNNWIGDGTSSNDYTIDEDQVIVVVGIADQAAYLVEENAGDLPVFEREQYSPTSAINIERFGRNVDMLPKDLNNLQVIDNKNGYQIQALPTMVGTERDRIHARLRSTVPQPILDANATLISEPRLLGITFGVGDFMNQEEF